MESNINIDDLIAVLNQLKNEQNQSFQPVSQQNNQNPSQIASVFSDISSKLQDNQSPQDLASLITGLASTLKNSAQNVSESQSNSTPINAPNPNFGDILQSLLGNSQNLGDNSQNQMQNGDIASVFSNILGNLPNNSSSNGGAQPMANIMNMAAPIFQNMQNTSANNPRLNLLTAAKPFLGTSFIPQVDHGIRLVSMARTAKTALGGLGGLSAISSLK